MILYHRFLEKFSPRLLYCQWKSKLPTEHLLASIDSEGLRNLLQYKDETGHPQYKKYFNAPYWLRHNLTRALYLGLNRSQSLSILDIGSGFGYFPYAVQFYGHRVIGIDVPGDTLFDKASEFLGVDRQHYRITEMEPMPSFGARFDLVTAFQVCFNGHIEGRLWDRPEWDFFLEDLFKNHVQRDGRVYLELNWSPHIQGWLPLNVQNLMIEKYRAEFDGPSRVTLFSPEF